MKDKLFTKFGQIVYDLSNISPKKNYLLLLLLPLPAKALKALPDN